MKILVTGAKGFIGRNHISTLCNIRDGKDKSYNLSGVPEVFECDVDTELEQLDKFCAECDFVIHLAGVNRSQEQRDFMRGNFGFTSALLEYLKRHKNSCPVVMSSSVQAELDNPYGRSKKAGEDLLKAYSLETGATVYIYRLPNVFGKWCRPNYNSAVATFCYNIARGMPITVNDENTVLNLVYIDDVVRELIGALSGNPTREGDFCRIPILHTARLGDVVGTLKAFRANRKERRLPDMSDDFIVKLYATYLSYLPEAEFAYPLSMNRDERGSFTELFRTKQGQFSVNVSKPNVTKGNHWHHTKSEKFIVVAGTGVVRLRRVGSGKVTEHTVSGDKIEVIDIAPGYTHNITNIGGTDMVTVMWASECFDPERPDTYYEEV